MIQWEYRIEKIGTDDCVRQAFGIVKVVDPIAGITARLEKLGQEGWELVSVAPPFIQQDCDTRVVALLYLKRQKQ